MSKPASEYGREEALQPQPERRESRLDDPGLRDLSPQAQRRSSGSPASGETGDGEELVDFMLGVFRAEGESTKMRVQGGLVVG